MACWASINRPSGTNRTRGGTMRKTTLGVSSIILATALTLLANAASIAAEPKSAKEEFDRGNSCLEKTTSIRPLPRSR